MGSKWNPPRCVVYVLAVMTPFWIALTLYALGIVY
jgi:hypothetical protein